jgi:DNA adenine methylase
VFFWLFNQGRLQDKRVVLNDINPELVNFYRVLQNDCPALIVKLTEHQQLHGAEYFYEVRDLDAKELEPVSRAARLMYLNRTCFNGLYRVNSKGQFNVPLGRYKNPNVCDAQGLQAASEALSQAEIFQGSYLEIVQQAEAGDLVYFDPPYVPLNTTSSFTSYTKEKFGLQAQEELAKTFASLAQRGVHVLLSNSDTPLVRELYEPFRKKKIKASRAINSKASRRQKVSELLIYP